MPMTRQSPSRGDGREELRAYKRKKEQWYRERKKGATDALRLECDQLEMAIARLKRQRPVLVPLSWRDIAISLQSAVEECLHTKNHLLEHQRGIQRLHEHLARWIHTTSVMSTPSGMWHGINFSLDNVALVASPPCARRQGLDWLSQAMYANTDTMYRSFPRRSPHGRLADETLILPTSEDQPHYLWRYQSEVPAPLKVLVKNMHRFFIEMMRGVAWTPADNSRRGRSSRIMDEETLEGMAGDPTYLYEWKVQDESGVNLKLLYREFLDHPGKVVVVGQCILVDELLPSMPHNRKSMTWIVMEEIDAATSIVRIASRESFLVTPRGEYKGIDAEAIELGCPEVTTLPEQDKLAALGRFVSESYTSFQMDDLMQKIVQACTDDMVATTHRRVSIATTCV